MEDGRISNFLESFEYEFFLTIGIKSSILSIW